MKCRACIDAAHDADTASVNAACRVCRVRDIARGPAFDECRKDEREKLTPAYLAELRAEFGTSREAVSAGNAQVKALWPAIQEARAQR